jgi:hypothetical protein
MSIFQGIGLAMSTYMPGSSLTLIKCQGSGLAMSRCHEWILLLLHGWGVAWPWADAMEWICYY